MSTVRPPLAGVPSYVVRRISGKPPSRQLPGGLAIPKRVIHEYMPATRVLFSSLAQRHHALRTHRRRRASACRRQHWSVGPFPVAPRAQRLDSTHASRRQGMCAKISRFRTRKLANEGCFGTFDRWRSPDSVRARPAARHTTSHLQKRKALPAQTARQWQRARLGGLTECPRHLW